ncbi:MAG: ATP-binding protein [Acidimicrobiales bacterium]
MATGKIAAAGDHLQRMVGTRPGAGLAELVWNALDASATTVDVTVTRTSADAVDEIVVEDDGHGFTAEEVGELFGTVGGSWKHNAPNRRTRDGARVLHGDKGEGRWRAFAMGDRVVWESVTAGIDGRPNQLVRVVMRAEVPDEFEWTGPHDTDLGVGTKVTVVAGMKEPNVLLTEKARTDLTGTVALYLTKYPDLTIRFDGTDLAVGDLIERTAEIEIEYENAYGPVNLTIIEWDAKIDRQLYLCDEDGAALHEQSPGIHAKDFVFTAYVRWAGFRVHESLLPLADLENDEVGPALNSARDALREYFRERQVTDTKTVVQGWRDENVYPFLDEPEDDVGLAEQALFNFVAVSAADAVNRIEDPRSKALSLQTMRVAVERDPSSVEFIMQEVLKLPESKIEEFRSLIERTSLTSILDATRLVTGRLEFLAGLDLLLFDPETAPKALERAHMHKMIENEPWLFGEAFSMHVSDRTLTALLKAHVGALGREDLVGEPVADADGNHLRRIDFMFGRATELPRGHREHLVVEIKRPAVSIGRDEIAQLEDYAMAVSRDGRFDLDQVEWDFVLLGTALDDYATSRANQRDLARDLVHAGEDGVRIWVRPWAEVLHECRHRLQFIREQLQYDPDADQAIAYLREAYPDYVPDHLIDR